MSVRATLLVLFLMWCTSCTEVAVDPDPCHDADIPSRAFLYQLCDNCSGHMISGAIRPHAIRSAVTLDRTRSDHLCNCGGVHPEPLDALHPISYYWNLQT